MIPEINLLPKRDTRQRTNRWLVFGGLIIWTLLLVLIVVQHFLANQDMEMARNRLDRLELEKTVLEEQLHEMETVAGTVPLKEAVDFVEKLTIPTSLLVEELLTLLPEQSHLTGYSYSTNEIDIQAEFESLNLVAQYVTNLEGSELFTDVKVDVISTQYPEEAADETAEGSSIEFTIVPRYHVDLSLQVNMRELVERGGDDESSFRR